MGGVKWNMTLNVRLIDKGGYYMKRFKKLTAGFLGVVMALSVCSFTALADGGDGDKYAENAKIEISKESELVEAIKEQKNGQTWEITGDFDVTAMVDINKSITINGNDYTLTFTGSDISGNTGGQNSFIQIRGNVDVKINNLTIDGDNKVKHCINVFGNGDETKVALDKVTMKNGGNSNKYGYGLVVNSADVTIKNVTTEGNCGGINVDTAGGEKSTLTIESATINEDNSVKIENQNDEEDITTEIEAKIEGGTFNGEVLIETPNKTNVSLNITGGEFNDKVYIKDDESTNNIEITGGTFATNVEKYLAEDLHLVKIDGEYVVMDEDEYLDDQRDSGRHSYSLKEGKTERDDEEEEPVVTPEPEEEEGPFSDVGKDNPNYDAIIEVYEKGWMAGIADGVFAPNGTLTRGMAVTILWNRAGQPEPASVAPFLDVTSDAWYAKAVAWAYENGITSGYGDTYGPDDALTTEQFTRMNDIATGKTPEVYVGGAPNATRGWVAGLLVME